MKKYLLLPGLLLLALLKPEKGSAQVNNVGQTVQTNASNHANNDVNSSVNNSLNSVENGVKGIFKKKKKPTPADTAKAAQANATTAQAATTQGTNTASNNAPSGTLAYYQNYDFVPGNTVLFEDEFTDDQSGEFPSHWSLRGGQAILNMVGTDKGFFLTDGNYVHVAPLMKNKSYLTNSFSVEWDQYGTTGYQGILSINSADNTKSITVCVKGNSVEFSGDGPFNGSVPADVGGDHWAKKWHHVAVAFRNNQLKVYVDKYRILVVPQVGMQPANLEIEGIGSQDNPYIFRNFKIADGVQFFMTGQTFTDAKIVTHGINFDIDKATITPQSMGTLNMIVNVLKSNPDLKFEVDGHTDNTGTAAHNLILSQQRADAVKAQLIVMGIDASRLTSKGFGDTKPIADNTTLDGKANNRRVEFVKI